MVDKISLIEKLSSVSVLVIGDIILDHYLWGNVHRISPEAPVPIVHAIRDTYSAGGAANVSLNLRNLGAKVSLIGHIADDEAGRRLLEILSAKGVNVIKTNRSFDTPTIVKTRVIVGSQQLCRIDREVSSEFYRIDTSDGFAGLLDDALSHVDAVIISDYSKGVITQPLVDAILNKEKDKSFFVAIDPKPTHHLSFQGAGLLTPNRHEALALAGITQRQYDEKYPLEEVCKRIDELYAPKLLVITLGAEGMAICKDGKVQMTLPTEAKEVFDVSGAGDTVIATLTAALAAGFDPYRSAWLANGAAGCVVSHVGTVPVEISELKQWLEKAED